MIEFSIHGATPKGGKPLCYSCKHASVVSGQNCEEFIRCTGDMFSHSRGLVTIRVSSCGSYHPSNVPWLHEMKEIAWKVEARRRGPSGFQQPEESEMEVTIKPPSGQNYQDVAAPTVDE